VTGVIREAMLKYRVYIIFYAQMYGESMAAATKQDQRKEPSAQPLQARAREQHAQKSSTETTGSDSYGVLMRLRCGDLLLACSESIL
jgi:hypothetical protein